jgi:hypothetical protein
MSDTKYNPRNAGKPFNWQEPKVLPKEIPQGAVEKAKERLNRLIEKSRKELK